MILSYLSIILFYLIVPFIFLILEKKIAIIARLNPVVILYIIGIILNNIKLIPESLYELHDLMSSISILYAIPLILLSLNILS